MFNRTLQMVYSPGIYDEPMLGRRLGAGVPLASAARQLAVVLH